MFIVISLTNCRKKEEFIIPERKPYSPKFDITDAKAIFMIDDKNEENFYKITNENKIEKINYIDTNGTTIENSKTNIYMFLLSDNFLIVNNNNEVIPSLYNNDDIDPAYYYYSHIDYYKINKQTGEQEELIIEDGGFNFHIDTSNLFINDLTEVSEL